MAFSLGQKLKDGYVIEKELGRGGFGITYLAKSKKGEQVVIKTLNDQVQRSPDFAKLQEEFVNEAVKLAKCDHPHVVQVEKLFQEGALWCIVMEYISGENLASFIMNRGVLPEADALRYISQIGAALELTHSKYLLHRDVKPANIMLRNCRGGKPCTPEAVLIDFGLARKFIPNQINSHTAFVTSGYAPIEQYYKRQIPGTYTDVYALAATLYVLLTKVLPESAIERAEEVRNGKRDLLVPPQRINSKISDQVNRAILQGMEIDAARRPQSVRKWLALLEVAHKNSFRSVDSEAPTIRIPGVSPFQEFFKQKAPKTPSPPPSIESNDYIDWNKQGNKLYDLKKYEEAINSFDKALALKPDFYDAWNNRGNALAGLKKYKEAIACYDKAIALKPDYYEAWFNRGNALAGLKKYKEAIASYDKALALKPDYYEAWNNRGNALAGLKKYKEAIASYDKALALKPDDYEAWNNRGKALDNLKKYEEAIASFDKAIALKPDDYNAWESQGNKLSDLEKYEEAIACYDKALALKPDYLLPWYWKANCHALLGQVDLAIESLRQVIKLSDQFVNYREWAKTNSDFDKIRQDPRFQALINS